MPTFAVSQFTTRHQTFDQDVELCRSLGIEAIEVCERKLDPEPAGALRQLLWLRDQGLRVTSVQPRCHALFPDSMCPDVIDPDQRAARYRLTIDLFAEAFPGQDLPLVAISGNAPACNYRFAHATARRIYPQLARYAGDRGLRIAFEPLNPILMNADSFIGSLDEALRLIDDVNHPAFGLMLDVWHVWREPLIAERIARLDGRRIFAIHLCDWPADEPRCGADRVLPGDGVIPLPALLAAIHRTGYDGAYCLEIFSRDDLPDSLWRQDAEVVVRRGLAGCAAAWQACAGREGQA